MCIHASTYMYLRRRMNVHTYFTIFSYIIVMIYFNNASEVLLELGVECPHLCIHMHSITNSNKQAHLPCSYDHQLHPGCSRSLLSSVVYSLFVSLEGSLSSNDGSSWGVVKHPEILPLLVSPLQSHPSPTLPHDHFLSVHTLHLIYCD